MPIPWFKDRVLICGDAAHACTPHLTQGAAMALEDAVVLAEELMDDRPLAESLRAFGERRYPRVKFVQDVSRGILNAEMAITADNIEPRSSTCARRCPVRWAASTTFLNQPA